MEGCSLYAGRFAYLSLFHVGSSWSSGQFMLMDAHSYYTKTIIATRTDSKFGSSVVASTCSNQDLTVGVPCFLLVH